MTVLFSVADVAEPVPVQPPAPRLILSHALVAGELHVRHTVVFLGEGGEVIRYVWCSCRQGVIG